MTNGLRKTRPIGKHDVGKLREKLPSAMRGQRCTWCPKRTFKIHRPENWRKKISGHFYAVHTSMCTEHGSHKEFLTILVLIISQRCRAKDIRNRRGANTRHKVLKSAIRASFKWENTSQFLEDPSKKSFYEDARVQPVRLMREKRTKGFSSQTHCADGNLRALNWSASHEEHRAWWTRGGDGYVLYVGNRDDTCRLKFPQLLRILRRYHLRMQEELVSTR